MPNYLLSKSSLILFQRNNVANLTDENIRRFNEVVEIAIELAKSRDYWKQISSYQVFGRGNRGIRRFIDLPRNWFGLLKEELSFCKCKEVILWKTSQSERLLEKSHKIIGFIYLDILKCHKDQIASVYAVEETSLISNIRDELQGIKRPSFLFRNWPFLILSAIGITFTMQQSKKITKEMLAVVVKEISTTFSTFIHNRILNPLHEIYNTIRYDGDYTNAADRFSLSTKEALQTELTSLEKMLLEFAKDNHLNVPADQIHKMAKIGDLSLIMQKYQDEIKNPIRGIIIGDLIRTILIQMQKLKLDGSIAMNSIDKLMKSNELNFELLAVIPAILLLIYSVRFFNDWIIKKRGLLTGKVIEKIRNELRLLEKFISFDESNPQNPLPTKNINEAYSPYEEHLGHLIVSVYKILSLSFELPISSQHIIQFQLDVADLLRYGVAPASERRCLIEQIFRYNTFLLH